MSALPRGQAEAVRSSLRPHEDALGRVGYRSPLLEAVGVPHLFTTRHALDPRRVAAAAGLAGAPLVSVRQVHGAEVLELSPHAPPAPDSRADALVSERADVLAGVHTADCVPVLLARTDGRRVAAVHAGWRGLVAGVLPRALAALGPGEFVAAIGPCLSLAHFEVGPEVAATFRDAGLASVVADDPPRRPHVDLRAAALAQLHAGGVTRIDSTDRCTYAHAEEFFSYRRDVTHAGGTRTGRLGAWIAAIALAGRFPV